MPKFKFTQEFSSMILFLKGTSNIGELYSRLLIIGFVLLMLSSVASIYANNPAVAQTSETPSSTSSPDTTGLPTIQITSHQDGQQVPPGELTIQGISSDDEETNCQVYADVNDITPMRNVTAAGESGEESDFSKWTFIYSQDYQLIKQGENELTAKISCYDGGLRPFPTDAGSGAETTSSSSPLSEWHTVNVTAITGATPAPLPSLNNMEEGEEPNGTSSSDKEEESEAESSSNAGGDGFFGGDPFFN